MEELQIEEHINLSITSNRSFTSTSKIHRSINSISNVLSPASMFSYPVTKGIHPSTPEVSETQLKQARILENLIGEVGFNRHKKLIRAHPNLVLEVADEFTRAFLFDIVEDSYRFVAGGESQTTFEMQGINIEIGIRNACDQLAEITGFNFLYSNNDDLFCGQSNGKKTHTTTISLSNNQPLKVVVINVHPKSSKEHIMVTFDMDKSLVRLQSKTKGRSLRGLIW